MGYLRAIPPIALFPVALVAIGPGALSIGVVGSLASVLYVFPGTADAARESATRYRELAAILSASKPAFLRHFVAPGAAVQALASSRVSATVAFAVCVAGEMLIGGGRGSARRCWICPSTIGWRRPTPTSSRWASSAC